MEYSELESLYKDNFSLGFLGKDINKILALICLTCYLTKKLKEKDPDCTCWKVLYKINKEVVPEKFIKALSIICSDLSYGRDDFPTFGVSDRDIPAKIKELLEEYIPF